MRNEEFNTAIEEYFVRNNQVYIKLLLPAVNYIFIRQVVFHVQRIVMLNSLVLARNYNRIRKNM